jgi:predicted ArsR family transcriptional regulator
MSDPTANPAAGAPRRPATRTSRRLVTGDASTRSADRILFLLKTKGSATAAGLARRLGVTPMAVRQHLSTLAERGLVAFEDRAGKVGRPSRHWRLTDAAAARFPDSHAELAVGLIQAARDVLGEAGISAMIEARQRRQMDRYRRLLPPVHEPLEKRVRVLAAIRRDEGYMASWSRKGGGLLLVENHCPICDAASACQGLCGAELALFEAVLGPDVSIERTEHILSGARRCAYLIQPR